MNNAYENIVAMRNIVNKIEMIINTSIDDIRLGKSNVVLLRSLGESMQTIADVLGGMISSEGWKNIYNMLQRGQYTDNISELLSGWLIVANKELSSQEDKIGICPMCKNAVSYVPDNGYFKKMQKEHNFKYSFSTFETINRSKRSCPVCGAMDRERLMAMFINLLEPEEGEKVNVLQIAPSVGMETWLKSKSYVNYESTDLFLQNVTFNADIQDMHMVEDKKYDIVLCSHILEHVKDDRKAMKELNRILKDDGLCIFLVPIIGGLTETDEEFGLSAEENWRRFGQDDHTRLYSKEDFLDRLCDSGFNVYTIGQEYFDSDDWKNAGLMSYSCLYVATKGDIGLGIEPYRSKVFEEELVSVVIPTHNRARCIVDSINSVLNQTYRNLELIVVDDCSKDNTEELVKSIADSRLRYIRLEKNQGANKARNEGIKNARGQYIAFNDSDDCWHEDKLYKQMRYMKLLERTEHSKIGAVYCGFVRIQDGNPVAVVPNFDAEGENVIGDIYRFMQSSMFLSTQTLLIKKDVLDEVGDFNESLKRLQDWELMLRISSKYKVMPVQEILVDVFVSSDALSNNLAAWCDTIKYVFELHNYTEENFEAYMSLVYSTIYMLGSAKDSEELRKDFYDYIVAQGAISKVHMQAFKEKLFVV